MEDERLSSLRDETGKLQGGERGRRGKERRKSDDVIIVSSNSGSTNGGSTKVEVIIGGGVSREIEEKSEELRGLQKEIYDLESKILGRLRQTRVEFITTAEGT